MTEPDPRFAGADPFAMLMVQMMYGNPRWAAEELLGLHDPSPNKEEESCAWTREGLYKKGYSVCPTCGDPRSWHNPDLSPNKEKESCATQSQPSYSPLSCSSEWPQHGHRSGRS